MSKLGLENGIAHLITFYNKNHGSISMVRRNSLSPKSWGICVQLSSIKLSCTILLYFCNISILKQLNDNTNIMLVKYPWNDDSHAYSGIPSYILFLQKMDRVFNQEELLLNWLVDKIQTAIDKLGSSKKGVTEQRLQHLFDRFSKLLWDQLNTIRTVQPIGGATECMETRIGHKWHYFDG